MAGGSQERARAARILVRIIDQGKTTDQSFGTDDNTPPLITELVYGTLRHYFQLVPLVERHLSKPFRTKDLDLRALLLVGAYQLRFMRVPDHAAINETVNAARALRKPWARGLINAVLRRVATEPNFSQRHEGDESKDTERLFGLPAWIFERLQGAFPAAATDLARASLERAPMSLRVNVARQDPAACVAALQTAGITAREGWFPEQLILDAPVPTRDLPGYGAGHLSVQDGGALFPAALLLADNALNAPLRVLDACAAPGGKLFHLAERAPQASFTALEIAPERLAHMRAEAERLGHQQIRFLQEDATVWPGTAAEEHFDAILLDAPCSGTGTLRRHPDIKVLRQPEDLPAYADLQRAMLNNLWERLNPGGTFVYCTCSLLEEENDAVIEQFLKSHPDATAQMPELPLGQRTRFGWQLLPLPAGAGYPNKTVDGFYFARMTRQEKAR